MQLGDRLRAAFERLVRGLDGDGGYAVHPFLDEHLAHERADAWPGAGPPRQRIADGDQVLNVFTVTTSPQKDGLPARGRLDDDSLRGPGT